MAQTMKPDSGAVIKTVDIPSRKIAAALAAKRPSTLRDRQEFAEALVRDASAMATSIRHRRISLGKT